MFWYSSLARQKLIVLPKLLSKQRQNKIANYIKLKTKRDFALAKKNHLYLVDIELLFMDTLLEFSPNNFDMVKRINKILDPNYHYEHGIVLNRTGSFGMTIERLIDGKSWIQKIPYDSRDDFKAEYDLAFDMFVNGGERFVPKVIGYDRKDGSYLQETATESLVTFICNEANLSNDDKKEIIIQIVKAVMHIHSRGIIHRDLHPGNIFGFKDEHNDLCWKISDFGLSYDFDNKKSCLVEKEGCRGDINYNSPEQRVRLDDATFRSDIYSIGRLINFIYNKNPNNSNHVLKPISDRCCLKNPDERYARVALLLDGIYKLNP